MKPITKYWMGDMPGKPGDQGGYQLVLAAHEMRPDLKVLLTSELTRKREA
ncbi:MAG: hypothetical protein V7750_00520 [Sneathiella sp.]